ncbi:MAG: hypothetical protein M3Y87_12005 [Myxococcota bacterium]|nr:hypothetical protein [Myxococcota bacterium]
MNRIALATVCMAVMFLGAGCKVTVVDSGVSTYDACSFSSDCNSAFDTCVAVTNEGLTDSQCTRDCINDLDCPGSGHCVSFDGASSFCYQTCLTSSICEIGWGCTDLSDGSAVCLPGSGTPIVTGIPPYNECTPGVSPDECSTLSEGCFGITVDGVTAGVCTSGCSSASTCPSTPSGLAGQCIAFSGSPSICFEGCIDSGDCLTGFACKSSLADGTTFPPICLPI